MGLGAADVEADGIDDPEGVVLESKVVVSVESTAIFLQIRIG